MVGLAIARGEELGELGVGLGGCGAVWGRGYGRLGGDRHDSSESGSTRRRRGAFLRKAYECLC